MPDDEPEAPSAPPDAPALPPAPAAPAPPPSAVRTKEGRLAAVRAAITARSAPPSAPPAPAPAEDDVTADSAGDEAEPETLAEALADKADEPAALDIDERALAAMQRREHASRTALEQEHGQRKAEIESLRASLEQEWKPRIEKVERHEKLMATARYDITALTDTLKDYSHEDRARLGALLWHEAAAELETDPGKKAESQKQVKALRDKHRDATRTTQLEKKLADLEAERAAEKFERKVDALSTAATKAVSPDKQPVFAALLKRAPEHAASTLAFAARFIFEKTGREPSASELLEQVEIAQVHNLKTLGLDPVQAYGLKPTTKAAPQPPKQKPNPEARETHEAAPAAPAIAQDAPRQAAPALNLSSRRDRLNHARGLR